MIAPWGEERKLLTAIRGGDRGAAEEIVERTYSAVFASLYRLCGDHDLAADLTQETYQKAWAALPNFDGRSQLFTWLYRIAYTTFLNYVRRPRRMTSLDAPESPEMPDRAPAVDQVLSDREEAERLRAAVLRLPEDLRFGLMMVVPHRATSRGDHHGGHPQAAAQGIFDSRDVAR